MNFVIHILKRHRNAATFLVRWGQGHITDTLQNMLVAAFFTIVVVFGGVLVSFLSYLIDYDAFGIDIGQVISGIGAVIALILWGIFDLRVQILSWAAVGANAVLRKEIQIASRPLPSTPIDIGMLFDEVHQSRLMRGLRSTLALIGFIAAAVTIFPVYTNIAMLLSCTALSIAIGWSIAAWAPLSPFWMPFIQKGVVALAVIFLILAPIRFYSPETFGRWNREHWQSQRLERQMAAAETRETPLRQQLINHYQDLINQELQQQPNLTVDALRASQARIQEYRAEQTKASKPHSDAAETTTSWTEWILSRDYRRLGGVLIWMIALVVVFVGVRASWQQKKIGPALAALLLLIVLVYAGNVLTAVAGATGGNPKGNNHVGNSAVPSYAVGTLPRTSQVNATSDGTDITFCGRGPTKVGVLHPGQKATITYQGGEVVSNNGNGYSPPIWGVSPQETDPQWRIGLPYPALWTDAIVVKINGGNARPFRENETKISITNGTANDQDVFMDINDSKTDDNEGNAKFIFKIVGQISQGQVTLPSPPLFFCYNNLYANLSNHSSL